MEENIYQNANETEDNLKLKSNIKKFPLFFKDENRPKLLKELKKYDYDFYWVGNYMTNCSKINYKYCLKNKKKSYMTFIHFKHFLKKAYYSNIRQIKQIKIFK